MNKEIEKIFENLDKWRCFPSYQLERRADIFFSIYLHGIMENCLDDNVKLELKDAIIPEFPIKSWSKNPKNGKETNNTWKVDYVLLSKEKVYFVELKTDMNSRKREQDEHMEEIQKENFYEILKELGEVMTSKTTSKKYYHLFCQLYEWGCYKSSNKIEELLEIEELLPREKAFKSLEKGMLCPTEEMKEMDIQIVYIQPHKQRKKKAKTGETKDPEVAGFEYIYFNSIINYLVKRKSEPNFLTERFIRSLCEWEKR